MKLHFEPDLEYQKHAIEAVCDLFAGQEVSRSAFTVTTPRDPASLFDGGDSDLGVGNRLTLLPDELSANLNKVQLRHGLKKSEGLQANHYNFTVEMETGTGTRSRPLCSREFAGSVAVT